MLKEKIKKQARKFLHNNVFPFVIIFALMVVQMIALFVVSDSQKMETYDNQINRELDNCITDIDGIIENVKQLMISSKLDSEIILALSESEVSPIEQQRIFMKLSAYKKMSSEISNIHIYNGEMGTVFSTARPYIELNDFPYGKTREVLKNGWEGMQTVVLADKADYQTDTFGSGKVLRIMMKNSRLLDDVIIVDINYDVLGNTFRSFENDNSGKVYVRSASGEILYGDNGQEELPVELFDVGLEEKKTMRSFYGQEYLVTHKRIKHLDADMFSVIPEDRLNTYNFETSTLTMINVVLILVVVLFAVLISLFRNIYKAAKKSAKEIEKMRQNDIRDNFLSRHKPILACLQHPTTEEIALCKEYLRSVLGETTGSNVALVRLDFGKKDDENFMLHEKYNMMNRVEEIFGRCLPAHAIYEQEDYALFLLTDSGIDHVAKCRKAYQECCEEFKSINIVPACYVSSTADVGNLCEIYMEVSNLAEYMFIYNRPMFLDFTLLFQRIQEPDVWIENGISGIKNNIMTPNEDLAAQVDNFINGLRELSVKDAKQAIYALYLAIGQCVEQIRSEDMSFNFDTSSYFPNVLGLKSLDEARTLFVDLAEKLQEQHGENDGNKYAMIVKKTLEIIEERLGDPALCRSMIADEIGISKPYLGRIFKEMIGISLSDAINEMRLKVVEEQLVSTNKSIKELISDVGIVNQSYFTVMFKKKYGMSPSEYRNKKGNLS